MTSRYLPAATRAALQAQTACAICGGPGPFEADHAHALALGGGNGPDNLRRICRPCHAIKTRRDVKAIAKAKRVARKLAGTWKRRGPKIHSRGFDKSLRRKFNGMVERRVP